jgi:hypothetical protein
MSDKIIRSVQYTMLTIAILTIGVALAYLLIQLVTAGLYQILIHTERSAIVLTTILAIGIIVNHLMKERSK